MAVAPCSRASAILRRAASSARSSKAAEAEHVAAAEGVVAVVAARDPLAADGRKQLVQERLLVLSVPRRARPLVCDLHPERRHLAGVGADEPQQVLEQVHRPERHLHPVLGQPVGEVEVAGVVIADDLLGPVAAQSVDEPLRTRARSFLVPEVLERIAAVVLGAGERGEPGVEDAVERARVQIAHGAGGQARCRSARAGARPADARRASSTPTARSPHTLAVVTSP